MGKGPGQIVLKRRSTNGQQLKMLPITSHLENTCQNHTSPCQNDYIYTQTQTQTYTYTSKNAGKDVEEEHLYTVGGNPNSTQYSDYGKQKGDFVKSRNRAVT